MSNVFAKIIYGCPLRAPGYGTGGGTWVEIQQVIKGESRASDEVGWHDTYDQSGDHGHLWFGVEIHNYGWGFSLLPLRHLGGDTPWISPTPGQREAVHLAWSKLSEEYQMYLGKPGVYLLVGDD